MATKNRVTPLIWARRGSQAVFLVFHLYLFAETMFAAGNHGACDPESQRTWRAPECYCCMNCLPRCPTVAMSFSSRPMPPAPPRGA